MEKQQAIERCRAQVLPQLEELAIRISLTVPKVRANAFEGPVGAATTYQGHQFGVECLLEHAAPDESDHVALVVALGTSRGIFVISADVCWGEGQLEADLLPEQTPVSEAALAKVSAELPQLGTVLFDAVRRGKPSHDV